MAFSLMGMQCKQQDPDIACLSSNYLHASLMEQVKLSSHEFIYVISFSSSPTWGKTSLGEQNLQHLGLLLPKDRQTWEGRTVMSLPGRTLSVDHVKHLGVRKFELIKLHRKFWLFHTKEACTKFIFNYVLFMCKYLIKTCWIIHQY